MARYPKGEKRWTHIYCDKCGRLEYIGAAVSWVGGPTYCNRCARKASGLDEYGNLL